MTEVLWNHFTGEGDVSPEGREVTSDPQMVKLCASAFEAVWELVVPHKRYRPDSPRRRPRGSAG
jgi:hypothetical protein